MGFDPTFFSLGRLSHVVEHYAKSQGTEVEVEVALLDGENFLVAIVQVYGSDLVFQTEDTRLICVPTSAISKIWIRPRREGTTGFQGVETVDSRTTES